MAEINIQRKERTTWPWILLGLLLVALLVWWLLSRNGGMTDLATEQDTTAAMIDTTSTSGTGGTTAAPGAIGEFVQWRSDYRARQEADTTHQFTAQGIRLLAAAIADAGQRVDTGGTSIAAVADSIRTHADALQRDWQSTNHANHVRLAFLQAAGALERLREQGFPNAATTVAQAREAAERVQPNRPLLEQREAVQQFFDVASQTLQSMQGAASTTAR